MSEVTIRRVSHDFVRGGVLRSPEGQEVVIDAEPVTVGRAPSAQLRIDDPTVSALHCELVATRAGVVLRDLGSTNGTFIEAVGVRECLLTAPCIVRVGDSEVRFDPSASRVGSGEDGETSFGPLIGTGASMRRLFKVLRQIAGTDLSLLITGETGTGKELVARAIHDASPRAKSPFIVIDCGALQATLAESTLFGHERGAFTGAVSRAEGAFQAARGGTVFLDELGELPDDIQPKLLRAIAERAVKPIGSNHYLEVDVRVVAATRRDLRRAMNAQRFREDLYFRIAQTRVELPPLRERTEDIRAIVEGVCRGANASDEAERIAAYISSRFVDYDWPGNVRELVNITSVLVALGEAASVDVLPVEGDAGRMTVREDEATGFLDARRRFEERYFRRLVGDTDGNISEIARRCGLARHQVRAHLKKLGIAR